MLIQLTGNKGPRALAGAIFTSPIQLELISHDIVTHPISSVYPYLIKPYWAIAFKIRTPG